MRDSQKLKMILDKLSWKILLLLAEKEMYPLEVARQLGIHEQKVYYHIRKLAKAGAITIAKEEKRKGATAKYYKPVSPAFGIEFPPGYKTMQTPSLIAASEQIQNFFAEFIDDFNGSFMVLVGSVREVEPGHAHSTANQLFDDCGIRGCRSQGRDYFRSPH